MSEELKPCPFCGNSDIKFQAAIEVDCVPVEGWCFCSSCNADGPIVESDASEDCRPAAAYAWNARNIPEGYALVPIESTKHMDVAAYSEMSTHRPGKIYKAMVLEYVRGGE